MAAATSATLASDQNQPSDPTGSIGMDADFNFDDDIDPGLIGSPSISETGSQAGVTSLAHQESINNASDLLMHQVPIQTLPQSDAAVALTFMAWPAVL